MASGQFFDPMVLLRALPLIATTGALLDSQKIISHLHGLPKANTKDADTGYTMKHTVDHYIRASGVVKVGITITTCVANLLVRKPALVARGNAGYWYVAVSVLAASHLALVWSMPDPEEDETTTMDKEWLNSRLKIMAALIWITDIPAMLCAWYAVARTCEST